MDSSKPIAMQTALVKVNESQNKTKRKEYELRPLEKEGVDKGEREINKWRMGIIRAHYICV